MSDYDVATKMILVLITKESIIRPIVTRYFTCKSIVKACFDFECQSSRLRSRAVRYHPFWFLANYSMLRVYIQNDIGIDTEHV